MAEAAHTIPADVRASPAPSPVIWREERASRGTPVDETDSRQPIAEFRPPGIDVPEKIVFCLDLSKEMARESMKAKEPRTVMQLTKRAISCFVRNKNLINPNHEFALIVLRDQTAQWYSDFHKDPETMRMDLDYVNPVDDSSTVDLTTIFEKIAERTTVPPFDRDFPPAYIVRAILVYGRSFCVPTFRPDSVCARRLLQSPNFFFDTVYIHEPPSDSNRCKDIDDTLWHIDGRDGAHVFETSRLVRLLESFAMLLAHPLQRPVQSETNYSLMPD